MGFSEESNSWQAEWGRSDWKQQFSLRDEQSLVISRTAMWLQFTPPAAHTKGQDSRAFLFLPSFEKRKMTVYKSPSYYTLIEITKLKLFT